MSSFVIKIIAIITMLCDHSGDAILGRFSFLNIIGRIAFPLFCFQLVVGYKHTKDVKKYLFRLFIFGIISQIPFSLFTYCYIGRFDLLNVFFTLAIGLLAVYILDTLPKKYKLLAIVLDVILMILAEFAQTDYGWFGVCLILCIYLFYNDKKSEPNREASPNAVTYFNNNILFFIVFFALCLIKYSSNFGMTYTSIVIAQILGTFFPVIFMLLYNGKKGPSLKYSFYIFYPAHLLILTIIHYLI